MKISQRVFVHCVTTDDVKSVISNVTVEWFACWQFVYENNAFVTSENFTNTTFIKSNRKLSKGLFVVPSVLVWFNHWKWYMDQLSYYRKVEQANMELHLALVRSTISTIRKKLGMTVGYPEAMILSLSILIIWWTNWVTIVAVLVRLKVDKAT